MEWGEHDELTGVVLLAKPRPKGGSGTARVRVTIDGKIPTQPVLLALDDIGQDLPDAYPRCLAWTDAEGWIEVGSTWPRVYHLVPKHSPSNAGGWRDFAGEFPAHGEDWPWAVEIPESGVVDITVDFPPERAWDSIPPKREDR
jgi:hypothetical protein